MKVRPERQDPARATLEPGRPDSLEVLVVEDSEDDALLVVDALRTGGFVPSCERVQTAAEMRRALQQKSWQVVLADFNLPGFGAMEAFSIYRECGLDIPFIIVSGIIGEEVAVAAMKSGVHDYLMKGSLARLAPAVRRELREVEIRREHARVEAELRVTYSELAAIHANAPVALLVLDEELRVTSANELAARLSGHPVAAMEGLRCGGGIGCLAASADSGGPGEQECDQCPFRHAVNETLRTGISTDKVEMRLSVAFKGSREKRWFLVSCGRIASNGVRKALVCAQDITELKRAQLELQTQRDAMALQAHLINLSRDAIIVADAGRTIRGWNKGAEETYGWTSAEAVGAVMDRLLQTSPTIPIAEMERVLLRDGNWEGEIRHVRQDGTPILTESRQVVLRDTEANILAILEINRDITERRRTADALKETVQALEAALAEKTVLLKEIHHRVKNNLAVIASLLSLKASTTQSTKAREALKSSEERVHSMALLHEHLYDNDRLDRIRFSDYARELVQELNVAFGHPDRIALELVLAPIELSIERAVPCALILNELVSNALKHAFPGDRQGRILVSFREAQPGLLELTVEDDGAGPPEGWLDETASSSLGLRIVRILTRQLDGVLVARSGVEARDPSAAEACSGAGIVIRFPARMEHEAAKAAGAGKAG